MSVVLRPPADSDLGSSLDALTSEAAALAGPEHWHTGRSGSAHFTVRALETYRNSIAPADPVIRRYKTALDTVAAQAGPARFQVTGLTLTPGTVMAVAVPLDGQADLFLDRLADELGPDGWHEADSRRDIWYLNLLHFTADIADPEKLIEWTAARRTLDLGRTTIPTAELIRFHHCPDPDRPFMRPGLLGSARLRGLS